MAGDCSSTGVEIQLGSGGGERMRTTGQPYTTALFTAVAVDDNMYSIELVPGSLGEFVRYGSGRVLPCLYAKSVV